MLCFQKNPLLVQLYFTGSGRKQELCHCGKMRWCIVKRESKLPENLFICTVRVQSKRNYEKRATVRNLRQQLYQSVPVLSEPREYEAASFWMQELAAEL